MNKQERNKQTKPKVTKHRCNAQDQALIKQKQTATSRRIKNTVTSKIGDKQKHAHKKLFVHIKNFQIQYFPNEKQTYLIQKSSEGSMLSK